MTDFTIMLIEDNPATRELLRIALERENIKVIEAEEGKKALEMIKLGKPNLILQDLILPDMDGKELNQQIRALPEGSSIPVLALSGFLSGIEELQESGNGFTGFLMKPVEVSHLIEVVRSFMPDTEIIAKVAGENRRIVLADDNLVQLKLTKIQLTNAGYNVTEATNGVDALALVKSIKPDAVISDVLMPGLDGFELCLKIRNDADLKKIPVILMSSHYLEESDHALAENVGANYYLMRKPDAGELIKTLEACAEAGAPTVEVESVEALKKEHNNRLIRQLEHQVSANVALARRCALQSAQLTLLSGGADALSNSESIEKTLQDVLATCLDAAGVSKGALFLVDKDHKLILHHVIGYSSEQSKNSLIPFFSRSGLLEMVMAKKDVVLIPSDAVSKEVAAEMLANLAVVSGLLVPLVAGFDCYGVMFMGSMSRIVTGADPIAFARAIGNQIGQTVKLASAFDLIHLSDQRYRLLMDNASCGILIYDDKGNIKEVNKKTEQILGFKRDDILNHNFITFVPEDDREHTNEILTNLITNKSFVGNEIRLKQPDGSVKSVELTVDSIDVGDTQQKLVILNDVTERNKLRTQAFLSDKLSTVGTLAAGIAHEINNPIAWVMANLGYLKTNIEIFTSYQKELYHVLEEPDANAKLVLLEKLIMDPKRQSVTMKFNEIVSETLQGAERVRDIVRNLKGFTRVDATEMTQVDLHQVIDTSISMAVPEFKYKARMEKNFAPNLPMVIMNSGKMHQIFLNLIVNAAQAIPDGDLQNNKVQITTQIDGDMVRVDISDTGKGISPEILPRIFDPFFTTKPAGIGTGLGLSICYDMIRSLGGNIKVKSTIGKGTTFSVYIPYKSKEEIAKAERAKSVPLMESPAPEPVKQVKGKKVLLIDDEPSLLKSIERMLEENHTVTTALGGKAAIEVLEKNKFDYNVIVCDLSMPDVNGADVYKFVKEKSPGLEQRIVFVTGGIYMPALIEFAATITNTRLEKPFAHAALEEAIEKVGK